MSDPHGLRPETIAPPRGLGRVGLLAGALALVVVAGGLWVRLRDAGEARAAATREAVPSVRLIRPELTAGGDELVLPGTMQAWYTAHIYARVGGYVRGWTRDIGASVGNAAPLAVIDTPELDQQIIEARASLARARAEAALARSTAARWNDLLKSRAVSVQETDEKNAAAQSRAAAVNEAAAALGRLLAMKSYATVRAPFAGVVTQRNIDIGDLVGPGSSAQTPLFTMADARRLRVYVEVPQLWSAAMKRGVAAQLQVPDWPGQSFAARLTEQASAIDPKSGALQVQLETANPALRLKPGGYAEVHFTLPGAGARLVIPSGALVLRDRGSEVATVDAQAHVHLVKVSVGRDLGGKVEIRAGLTRAAQIIANPPDSISEGEQVRIEAGRG